jgi:hypothetical protein
MERLRTDIVSLYDLDFRKDRVSIEDLQRIENNTKSTPFDKFYRASFNWIFYGKTLPGFDRFSVPQPGLVPSWKGSSLLIHREYGVGVFSVWNSFDDARDPLELKQKAWEFTYSSLSILRQMKLDIEEIERHYPFVAIQVQTDNLPQFCKENAEYLGKVFTGDFEYEDKTYLEGYIQANISRRSYEQLFIRWTEALGVYSNTIDDDTYEKTLFRAVQIFETCVVVRRMLNNINKKINDTSASLSLINPRPWTVNNILQSFKDVERSLIVSPPIRSVEGGRLLESAYKGFGIESVVNSTKSNCNFLETRFQWVKTQLLVAVAVGAYIIDKVIAIFVK